MRETTNKIIVFLLFWFTLDITGFSFGKFCLVESPGFNSVDTLWWGIFVFLTILYFWKGKIWNWILWIFINLWIVIQYYSHWHYTIFGVSEKKLNSYNAYFSKTYHIIPSSDKVLIPDLYHIVLHILLVLTAVFLIKKLEIKKVKKIILKKV